MSDMTLPVRPETPQELASQIIQMAGTKDLDVQKLQALIDMQQQLLRAQAEAAFNAAFCEMQGELPVIAKTSEGDGGKWSFAGLAAIVDQVRPILQKHGFSLSHQVEWPDPQTLKVIGILAHRLGHQRTSQFQSAADKTGSKNAIQGLGSANTYGRRYTTCDLLGIATRDDDGQDTEPMADPPGFEAWIGDLTKTAAKGTDALKALWVKGGPLFRSHLGSHHPKVWEGLKRAAAKAGAK